MPKTPLPKEVKVLGLVSLLNDAASDLVLPLLPAFVVGTLGMGPEILGLMEGLAESVAAFVKYFAGLGSDRLGKRKPLTLAGYGLAAVIRPLFALITSGAGWLVVVLRSLDRVGKGLRSAPRDAILAQVVAQNERGRAFGFHRAMDNAGAVLGPLMAFILLSGFEFDLRTVFLLAAVPGVATVALLLFALHEPTAAPPAPKAAGSGAPEAFAPHKGTWGFLLALTLFTLGNSTDLFLVLHAQKLGLPVALAPVLWLVLNLVKTLAASPGGKLSDRIGRRPAILAGWTLYALCYLGFALADSAWQVWPLFVAYGCFYGLTEAPEKALTADLFPKHKRGHGFGLYYLATGLSALPASLLAGFLWSAYGPTAALGTGAAFAALAALVFSLSPLPKAQA